MRPVPRASCSPPGFERAPILRRGTPPGRRYTPRPLESEDGSMREAMALGCVEPPSPCCFRSRSRRRLPPRMRSRPRAPAEGGGSRERDAARHHRRDPQHHEGQLRGAQPRAGRRRPHVPHPGRQPETPVSGAKKNFHRARGGRPRRGLLPGRSAEGARIRVLPREIDPAFSSATGVGLYDKRGRSSSAGSSRSTRTRSWCARRTRRSAAGTGPR
jgi:hypothetical protein